MKLNNILLPIGVYSTLIGSLGFLTQKIQHQEDEKNFNNLNCNKLTAKDSCCYYISEYPSFYAAGEFYKPKSIVDYINTSNEPCPKDWKNINCQPTCDKFNESMENSKSLEHASTYLFGLGVVSLIMSSVCKNQNI